MKLSQLRYFQAVCKYNNMTAASAELHVSQPCLSNAIRELENEFGVVLFLRSNNRLSLTEEGETLLSLSNDLIRRADALTEEMKLLGTDHREIRLGLPPGISSVLFPQIFRELQLRYPDTQVLLREYGTPFCIKYMKEGILDAALISGGTSLPSYFDSMDVCTLKINFYTSVSNPLSALPLLTESGFQALQETPLVLLHDGTFIHSFVNACFREDGLTPNIVLRTNQLHTVQQMVSDNVASTFLYEGAFPEDESITAVPLEKNSDTKIRLIWNRKYQHSSGVHNLIKTLSDSIKFS